MTNLAWLAAVLQPYDVAPHPNFADPNYDGSGPPLLAALVLGDPWRSHRAAEFLSSSDDDLIGLAAQCLRSDTIAVSVATLVGKLDNHLEIDQAQAAALALIACTAAAELDDYDVCFHVLDTQLRSISDTHTPDDVFLQAALLQQKALRLYDAGRPHLPTIVKVGSLLSQLVVDKCGWFPTSPGVSWSSHTTLRQIKETLTDAASSLVPIDAAQEAEAAGLPTLQEVITAQPPSVVVTMVRNLAEHYTEYVERVFARQFGSAARTIGGSSYPDLFFTLLALELVGHGRVYGLRRDHALLRLVQDEAAPEEMADLLRLLRHAAAKNELDLALLRFRDAGPLSVLSDDARQVLRARTAPEMLRTVEIRVLHVAAELLTPDEARVALDAIRATLDAGGPPDLPRRWDHPLLRKEVAWRAAAALANVCGSAGEISALLLREATEVQHEDQLLDQALWHAAAEIEWGQVSQTIQEEWLSILSTKGSSLPGTAEVIFAQLRRPIPPTVASSPGDALIHRLNSVLSGRPIDPAIGREGVPLVREAMANIRSDAARGSYSFGGFAAADAAAGLVIIDEYELWPELADFLLDFAVPRLHRTPAFERLARIRPPLPEDLRPRFRENAQKLLSSIGPDVFEPMISPYPAALRFLGVYQLIDDAEVYEKIAILAGAPDSRQRREAADTVAALAAIAPRGDLLALAVPLSHDSDVDVRARAARALALLAKPNEVLGVVASRRLTELLNEDGLLVPLHTLRALADLPEGLTDSVRRQIETLADLHPARSVRTQAGRLLGNQQPD